MTISVIIPALNEEQHIAATLNRLDQPAIGEVIIVDGGSHDATLARASSARPEARMMSAPTGRARQMNAGAAVAKGDVLLFVHADTLLPPTAGAEIESAFQSPGVVGGWFNVRLDEDTGLYPMVARLMNWRSRLTGIATGDQAIFARRSVFNTIGGFPDIPIMEDIAFTKRLRRSGRTSPLRSYVVTSARRWARHGTARTIFLMWWMRLLFFLGVGPHRLKQWYPETR
jgi:rSAM/selenodomain-associated transferase 2